MNVGHENAESCVCEDPDGVNAERDICESHHQSLNPREGPNQIPTFSHH